MIGLSTSGSISFGCALVAGQEAGAETGGGEDGFADGVATDGIVAEDSEPRREYTMELRQHARSRFRPRPHRGGARPGCATAASIPTRRSKRSPRSRRARRRLIPELEGLKRQQNTSGDEIARAKRQGQDTTHIQEANRARAQQIKQLGVQLDSIEHQRDAGAADAAEPAARERAGRQERGRQRRSAAARRAARVRFRAAGALGSRARRSASSTSSAATQIVGRALRGAERRRRAARARAHQLHARPAHARARLPRGRAAVPGQQRVAHRHRQPAEVRGGSVQDRRRLGSVPRSRRRKCR